VSELPSPPAVVPRTIWTIGHSTRPLATFLELLNRYELETVADVRRFPGSRRHPEYGSVALQHSLEGADIGYRWLPSLGGRRKPRPDSINTAWRSASFRGYADYMETSEFAAGVAELLDLARSGRTVLMCAEAVWWRCHRSLIADLLRARGVDVIHILGLDHSVEHPLRSPVRIVQGRLTYQAADD
jgi:uncharacterized protein (DUF488 family)